VEIYLHRKADMSDPEAQDNRVVVGIDTHADTHHIAVVTEYGKPLNDQAFPTTAAGYREALTFITGFGEVLHVGMEGTGTYGAALTKVLQGEGIRVIEVNRPDRQQRRLKGKQIHWTRIAQPSPSSRAGAPLSRRPRTALWNAYVSCAHRERPR
jgi:transposase